MFDLDARWQLHPQVALRPEPFGALLYHFGTRKLSFLKNLVVVDVVTFYRRAVAVTSGEDMRRTVTASVR